MISDQVEQLVLDVVLSHADDDGILDLNSDATILEVDHLTMTQIVLALETELGIELPTYLEDARTVAELVTGVLTALSANTQGVVRPTRLQ
jgi:acyl carrier protein